MNANELVYYSHRRQGGDKRKGKEKPSKVYQVTGVNLAF